MDNTKYQAICEEIISDSSSINFVDIEKIIRSQNITINVAFREGYENKASLDTNLHRLFLCSSMKEYFKKHKIELNDIGMVSDISSVSGILLYITFGDEEFAKFEIERLEKRRNKDLLTIPLVVFSESFFKIPYGEYFGYMDIMDVVTGISIVVPVAFSELQIQQYDSYYDRYLWWLSYYFKMLKCKETCNKYILKLENEMLDIENIISDYSEITSIQIKLLEIEINNVIKKIEKIENNIDKAIEEITSNFEEIQKNNYEDALKRRNYFKGKSFVSNFGNKIGLRYGDIIKLIDEFTNFVDEKNNNDQFIIDKLNETTEILNRPCELALVGTFSSGKTTFINSLLGGEHNFRTSASHNTAVLMVVKKTVSEKDNYIVKYKNKITYDLVIPSDDGYRAQTYNYKQSAIVERVDFEQRFLLIRLVGSGRKIQIDIDNENKIIVAPGDRLNLGTRLTEGKGVGEEAERVKCVSLEDIEFIYSLMINDKHANNCKIIINYDGDVNYENKTRKDLVGKKAKNVVLHLKTIIKPISDKVYDSNEIFTIPELGRDVHRVTFECDYKRDDRRVLLDNQEWEDFCDSKEKNVFMERPECYILSESLNVEMGSNFLEYCNIIDTPGFGSVTERHDAISERYIRNHKGILLIMIRLDNRPDKQSLNTLLNKITRIYNSDSNLDKNNVYFMLNCYSNLASEDSLTRFCKSIANTILKKGFSQKKIYACNLKQSLESGQYFEKQYQMPSYKEFINTLKLDIEGKGIVYQLHQVSEVWGPYLDAEIKNINKQLIRLKEEKNTRENDLKRKKVYIQKLKGLKMKSFNEIEKEIESKISILTKGIRSLEDGLASKKNWRSEKDSICEAIDRLGEELREDELIEESYNIVVGDLCKYSDGKLIKPTPIDPKMKRRYILPTERLKSLYLQILNQSWGILWRKGEGFINEMVSEIEEQMHYEMKNYKDYYNYVRGLYESAFNKTVKDLEDEIKALSSEDSMNSYVRTITDKIRDLREIKKKWEIIENKINGLEK